MKKYLPISLAVLGCGFMVGSWTLASATAGTESDPLVTKSYIEQWVTPSLTEKASEDAQSQLETMTSALQGELAELKKDMESGSIVTGGSGGQYQLISLIKGEQLSLDLGTQVVLRIGTATISATSFPALVDLTNGDSLSNGDSLTANHLYLSTIEGRVITATSASTKIMVYGGYQVN